MRTREARNVCQDRVLSLERAVLIQGRGCHGLPAEGGQGLWDKGLRLRLGEPPALLIRDIKHLNQLVSEDFPLCEQRPRKLARFIRGQ